MSLSGHSTSAGTRTGRPSALVVDDLGAQTVTVTDRRTMAIVFGAVLVLVGLLLVWSGLTPLSQSRDADGSLLSDPLTIDRPSHAVVTNDVGLMRGHYDCAAEETLILGFSTPDEVRMRGVATGSNVLFMGIAPAAAVEIPRGSHPR